MRRISGLIHESIEERKNITRGEYKKAGVLPGVAASCKDGIILIGVSSRPKVSKIWRILDRSAFLGVGDVSRYEELYNSISINAKVKAFMERSAGDSIVMEDIIRLSANTVRSAFRDLFNNDYFECDIIIARLGFEKEEDELCAIDFTGQRICSKSFICIPDGLSDGLISDVNSETMRDVFVDMWHKLEAKKEELKQEKLFFEVATLSREAALAKKFKEVYKKLDLEDISSWMPRA